MEDKIIEYIELEKELTQYVKLASVQLRVSLVLVSELMEKMLAVSQRMQSITQEMAEY